MIKKLIAAVAALSLGFVASAALVDEFTAGTVYVDPANPNAGDGTVANPFKTVEAAVEAAAAGSKIILAAGVYDSEAVTTTLDGVDSVSRIVLTKKLYLLGAGRNRTIIVGADATNPDSDGLGTGAVRGILLTADAAGSLIEGLTVMGGRTETYDATQVAASDSSVVAPNIRERVGGATTNRLAMTGRNLAATGGGLYYLGTDSTQPIYIVDCEFTQCRAGFSGGALYGWSVVIRTEVTRSYAMTTFGGTIARVLNAFSSVFSGNGKVAKDVYDSMHAAKLNSEPKGEFANCTFNGNLGGGVAFSSTAAIGTPDQTAFSAQEFYNCIFFVHGLGQRHVNSWAMCRNCCQNMYGSLANTKTPVVVDDTTFYTNGYGNVGGDYYPRLDEDREGQTSGSSPAFLRPDLFPPVKFGRNQFAGGYGSYRLREGSILVDRGGNNWITAGADDKIPLVPEEYRAKDFYGESRVKNDVVDQGAAEGGYPIGTVYTIAASSYPYYVNGCYVNSSLFPGLQVSGTPGEELEIEFDVGNKEIYGLAATALKYNSKASSTLRRAFPNFREKKITIGVDPASLAAAETNTLVVASSVKWASPDGSDTTGNGTETNPYQTLQKAVDASSVNGVVFAMPGTYDQGGVDNDSGVTDADWPISTGNRVKISKNLRLVGVEGAENTVIMGAEGTNGFINTGCGEGAKRCVGIVKGNYVQVQGFTLTGGHTDSDPVGKSFFYQLSYDDTKTPKTVKSGDGYGCYNWGGGAVCGGTSTYNYGYDAAFVDDCIISNNVAYHAAGLLSVFARRCVITANRNIDKNLETNCTVFSRNGGPSVTPSAPFTAKCSYVAYACNFSSLSQCLVYDNDTVGETVGTADFCSYYNCIFSEPNAVSGALGSHAVYNSIFYKCASVKNYAGSGNILWPANGTWSTTSARTVVDPLLGFDAKGRLLIGKGSPALTAGTTTTADNYFAIHAGPGLGGVKSTHLAGGKMEAGCYFADRSLVRVAVGASENPAKTAEAGLEPGRDTILNPWNEVVFTAIDPRKVKGYRVNGQLIETSARTYTLGIDAFTASISPVYELTQEWFVDAVNGNDEFDGFTKDTAKKTLNNALVYTKNGDTVHAAEGVYTGSVNTKAYTGGTLPAVAVVPNGVTLVADGERDKTIIEGKWGTGTSTQSMTFGPDAIRGLVMMTNTVLQGFLIRNCGTFNSGEVTGGAVYGTPWSTYKDCFFSNCCARSTCAAFTGKGTAIRCKFYRMGTGGSSGICDGGKLYNCYIDRCFDNPLGGYGGTAVNCTLGPKNCVSFNESSYVGTPVSPGWTLKNVVLLTPSTSGQSDRNMGTLSHCIVHKSQKIRYNTTNWGDTKFIETAEAKVSADGQPLVGSPLIDAGDNDALEEGLSAGTDLAGNKRISHKIVDAGCYEFVYRPTAHVKSVAGGIDPAEDCLIDVGATQIVKATDDKRNVLSFTVTTNGVPVELEAGARLYAWTPMDEDDELFVTATYATNWYVNANAADDSGTGWTAETPKKTLAGVMEAVIAGDCVHAAPGNYNEGVMTNETAISTATPFRDPSKPHGNRVVIPEGVALVATDGPDVTFITGAKSVANTASGGRGVDAVRCVAIRGGSYLEGFTLQTGHSNSDGGSVTDDNAGGGILGTQAGNADTPHIVNCVIKSCSGYVGGAAYGCFLERCRITDCANSSDGITYYSKLRHCVIHDLTGSIFRYCYGADFCTVVDVVYPTWTDPDFGMAGGGCIQNSILNYKSMGLDWKGRVWTSGTIKNSIVSTDSTNVIYAASCENLITNNNRAAIFALGSWKLFKGSVAVDVGDMDRFAAIDDGTGDFEHNQRVYNGTVDMGAYEYDWRTEYAADLVSPDIVVTEASPEVVETNDKNVSIPNGATVKLDWPGTSGSYEARFAISGGTLTVTENGKEPVDYTEGGSYVIAEPTADTKLVFSYAGTGSATLLPFLGAYEAKIGTTPYTNFADAYAAVSGSDAITLLKKVTWTPAADVAFKTVAIDTNGFTLAVAQDSVTAFNAKGYVCKFDDTTLKVGLPFGGLGTANDPYTIADAETIRLLANGVNASSYGVGGSEYFKQTADIDLNNVPFAGIGSSVNFSGHYDGFGKTVRNLVFTNATYRGFFAQTKNATVKDLTIELGVGDTLKDKEGNVIGSSAFSLSGYDYANPTEFGGAAMGGKVESTSFTGCTTKGAIACTHNAGGFVVRPLAGSTFTDCTNLVNVVGTYTKVGGFAVIVQNEGVRFTRCINKGNVSTYGNRMLANNDKTVGCDGVGGVLAYTSAALTMDSCVNEGTITYTATEVVNPSPDETAHVGIVCVGSFAGLLKKSVTFAGANTVNNTNVLAVGCCLATPSPATSFLATVDDNGIATFPATLALDGTYKVMAYGVDTCNLQFTKNDVPRENPIRTISFDRSLYAGFEPTVMPAVGVKVTGPAIEGDVLTYTVRRRMGTLMILQ